MKQYLHKMPKLPFPICKLMAAILNFFIDIIVILQICCHKKIPHPKILWNRGIGHDCSPTRSILH